jgi:hypothetical protein
MGTTIVTNGDDDCGRQQQRCRAIHVRELSSDGMQKKSFFFFLSCFFLKNFFASSTDFVACSFDHLCRKLTKMEIKK